MVTTALRSIAFACGLGLASLVAIPEARACGGFFCSQAAPVNQAAERIIFADNGDGTVTAVIQILYQGPAEKFSWLLPISTVPTPEQGIALASNLAFSRLQSATNPQYSLTTRVEGTCRSDDSGDDLDGNFASPSAGGVPGAASPEQGSGPKVVVEASGLIGAFEWTVISLNRSLPDPADAAVEWLEENGYDVQEGARGLLGPYLADGLYLLALRLTKGSDAGSIRPIALTYAAAKPMIPIKLTAVAANEDMGVMTWLLSKARGVPENYLSLELNEAKINWFNAASTYNSAVIAAADEAGGQGFVTEFAGKSSTLARSVWTDSDATQWQAIRGGTFGSLGQIFRASLAAYASFDGFWDAVGAAVTLPAPLTLQDLRSCPSCYQNEVQFAPSEYIAALEEQVIEPVRMVQSLIDAHPYVTRLYTTMSAEEMTADPLFTFNPELADVSNVHTAERVIECAAGYYEFEAPWRIELPQGGVVRGRGASATTWPPVTDQPSNTRILRMSSRGSGVVLEDNSAEIRGMLDDYNAAFPKTAPSSGGCGLAPRAADAGWLLGALALLGLSRRRRQAARASSR